MHTLTWIKLVLLAVISWSATGCQSTTPANYRPSDPASRNSGDVYPNRD